MEIELPDGTIAEFPDDMPAEQIQQVIAEQFPPTNPQPPAGSEPASVLPFSNDGDGGLQFDSNAGILGALKRGLFLPGEVMRGEVDPNSDEGMRRAIELSAIASPINPATRSAGAVVPGARTFMKKIEPKAPTPQQLKAAATQAYGNMRQTGATYPGAQVKSAAEAIKQQLQGQGLNAATAKQTVKTLDQLSNPPPGAFATIDDLHAARKTFGQVGQNFNKPSDQRAASEAIGGLDDLIGGLGDRSVFDPAQVSAGKFLREGNANYAAAKRSDLVGGIGTSAELRAAAANSGQNIGNATRSRVASALESPKRISGFNDAERAALEGIVTGSKAANRTRTAGNYLGGGGGLGALSATAAGGAAGGLVGGPIGAGVGATAAPIAGILSKNLSNRLTTKALSRADELIRKRSPLYEQLLKKAPSEAQKRTRENALIRALLLQQPATQGQ